MKKAFFENLLFCLPLLLLPGSVPTSTGSVELDKVIQAPYEKWEGMIEPRLPLFNQELGRLNPHFEHARKESITNNVQQVILSLFALQKKDGLVVELGSWTGGGALLMAPFSRHDQSYHAVDTFNADKMSDRYIQEFLKGKKHLDVFYENIRPLRKKVVVHQGYTHDVATTWPKNLAIDLLFIDADHSYRAVSTDWKDWSPFVRKGGIIAFHDYYIKKQGGNRGVREFVNESIVSLAGKNFYCLEGLARYIVE